VRPRARAAGRSGADGRAAAAGDQLHAGAGRHGAAALPDDGATTALTGWALVHGPAALLLEGRIAPEPGTDAAALAHSVTGRPGAPN
jgi:hypothetical protein